MKFFPSYGFFKDIWKNLESNVIVIQVKKKHFKKIFKA